MRRGMGLRAVVVMAGVLLGATLPAVSPAQDEQAKPSLPRVLLLGDNTFQNHHGNAARALAGRAELVRSTLGYLSTGAALDEVERVLQGERWDLICFNFGLSDLMCRDPRTRAIRAMSPAAGGVPVTSPEQYADHLDALVARFRASGAKLIWTTTLPLSSRTRSGALDDESVQQYNAIAAQRMREHGVPIVDTHAQITGELARANNPRQVDRLHNEILKRDLSAPLVGRIVELAHE